jgi:hypothetical protein
MGICGKGEPFAGFEIIVFKWLGRPKVTCTSPSDGMAKIQIQTQTNELQQWRHLDILCIFAAPNHSNKGIIPKLMPYFKIHQRFSG